MPSSAGTSRQSSGGLAACYVRSVPGPDNEGQAATTGTIRRPSPALHARWDEVGPGQGRVEAAAGGS